MMIGWNEVKGRSKWMTESWEVPKFHPEHERTINDQWTVWEDEDDKEDKMNGRLYWTIEKWEDSGSLDGNFRRKLMKNNTKWMNQVNQACWSDVD